MDLPEIPIGPMGGPVDYDAAKAALEKLGAGGLSEFDQLKILAAKTGSDVVMSQGDRPSMYLRRGTEHIPLPVFYGDANVFTVQGAAYGGVSRIVGGRKGIIGAQANYARALDEAVDASAGLTQAQAFKHTRRNLLRWRQQSGQYLRSSFAGATESYWVGNKVRIAAKELDPAIRAQIEELSLLEASTIKNISSLKRRASGGLEPAITSNIERATKLREQILDSARDIYGLHGGVKYFAVKKRGKNNLGYLEFSRFPVSAMGLDPFSGKYSKGRHQTRALSALTPAEGRSLVPALIDPRYAARNSVAAAFQQFHGIKANATLSIGEKTMGYFPTEVSANVAHIGLAESASPWLRQKLGLLGDSAAYMTSNQARFMVGQSLDARGMRRVFVPHYVQDVRGIGAGNYHPLIGDAIKNGPGLHNVAFDRSTLGTSTFARGRLEDGSLGRTYRLRRGEAITGIDVGTAGSYFQIERANNNPVGSRILLGTHRQSVAGSMIVPGQEWRFGNAPVDFLTLQSSYDPANAYLSTLAERIRLVNDPQVRLDMMQALSQAMGGEAQISKVRGAYAGDYVSASFGRDFHPGSGKEVLDKFLSNVKSKFGTSDPTLTLAGGGVAPLSTLMESHTARLSKDQAKLIAQQMGLEGKDFSRAWKGLYNSARVTLSHTTFSARASQPGYRTGAGAVKLTFGRSMNLFEQIMSPRHFKPEERYAALSRSLTGDADPVRNAAISVWNSIGPGTKRGQAVTSAIRDFAILNRYGDEGLVKELAARGEKPLSIEEYRKAYSQRLGTPEAGAGGWRPHQIEGTPFGHKSTGVTWVDTGVSSVMRTGGEFAPSSRYIPILPGRVVGARPGATLRRGRSIKIGSEVTSLVDASIGAHNALLDNTVNPADLATHSSKVIQAFSNSSTGRRGLINRGFNSNFEFQTAGALLPMGSLNPGEVGITEAHLRTMGMSAEMIKKAKAEGIYGFRFTDPAFSLSHTPFSKAVVLDKETLRKYGKSEPAAGALFMHPYDLPSIQRDFDADRGAFAFSSKMQDEMKTLYGASGAAERSKYARTVVENVMSFDKASEFRSSLRGFGEMVMEKEAAAAAAQAVPGAATGIAHTVAFGLHNLAQDISRGFGPAELGLSRVKDTRVLEVAEKLKQLMSGSEGAERLWASSQAVGTTIYAYLKKGSKESGMVGDYLTEVFSNSGLSEEGVDRAAKNLERVMDFHVNKQAQTDLAPELADAVGRLRTNPKLLRDVAWIHSASAYLASNGARTTISATRTSGNLGLMGEINEMSRVYGMSRSDDDIRASMSKVGRVAEEATLEDVRGLGGKIKEWLSPGKVSEATKDLWSKASSFVGSHKWAKYGMAGAGILALGKLMSNDDESSSSPPPQIYSSGGAPMPPSPVLNVPGGGTPDFGIINRGEARVERVYGVRSHPQVTAETDDRNSRFQDLAMGAYGIPGKPMLHSGSFSDNTSGPKSRQYLEYQIQRQMHSSF